MIRYYYDAKKGMCMSFQYNGCRGNANRFDSLKECKNTCKTVQCKFTLIISIILYP